MPAPTNDNIQNAVTVTGDNWQHTADLTQATVQPGERDEDNNPNSPQSVWYLYIPSTTGTVTFDTTYTQITYSDPDFGDLHVDTVFSAWSAPDTSGDFSQHTFLGYNDDGGSAQTGSAISFNVTAGQVYYLRVDGYGFQQGAFTVAQTGGPAGLTGLPCFCAGTMIRTLRGETAVEALVAGDVLVLASGAVEVVRFVGVTTVRAPGGRYPQDQLPVIIRQGALGENQPNRDLHLAPGHAIAHGDLLVPARRLVNGTTVVVDAAPVELKYYHVRLDRHEVLVSNGVASESFKHDPKWVTFDNADQYAERFPLDAAMSEAECRLAHREAGRRVSARYPAPRDLLAVIAQRAEAMTGEQVAVQAA